MSIRNTGSIDLHQHAVPPARSGMHASSMRMQQHSQHASNIRSMHQTFAAACMHSQQHSSAFAACISIHSLPQHASLIRHSQQRQMCDAHASPTGHPRGLQLVPFITLMGSMHRHLQQYAPAFAAACIGISSMHALAFAAACISICSMLRSMHLFASAFAESSIHL